MRLSSKELRNLHRAANVTEAQQELAELNKSLHEVSWYAEAGLLAAGGALAVLGLLTLLTINPVSETAEQLLPQQQIADLSLHRAGGEQSSIHHPR